MKRIALILMLLTALALILCANASELPWQAYLMPDGSVRVTDAECEGTPITLLTLGLNEARYIEVENAPSYSFRSSSVYVNVDEDGMLLSEGLGRATLRVYYSASGYIEIRIIVNKAPTSIKLSRESVTLKPNEQAKLEYTLSRDSAGYVSFYSTDEDVVSVNENGELYAIAPGSAQIYAETYNGKTASCNVRVSMPAPAVIHADGAFTGYAYESFNINAYLTGGYNETLSFFSQNPDICQVDEAGAVHCLNSGEAVIELRASGGNVLNCRVNVLPAANIIAPQSESLYMYEGGSAQIYAKMDGGSGAFTSESQNEEILVCDETNTITALKTGKTKVILTAPSGASCELSVTVLKFPKECAFNVSETNLAVGESLSFSAASEYTVALPFTFESSNPSVLRVEGSTAYAAYPGKATLSAISGGVRQEFEIEVVTMALNISFANDKVTLGVGDDCALELVYETGGGKAEYFSNDTSIATVDDFGVVTARARGEAQITARLKNGTSASVTVNVMNGAANIYPNIDNAVIGEGDSLKIDFGFDEGCYSNIVWRYSDNSIVQTDSEGSIRSIGGTGEIYVTAQTAMGASVTIPVKIINAPQEFTIAAQSLNAGSLFTDYVQISAGESFQLNPRFDGYTSVSFTCHSFDEDIATVNSLGEITGISKGTARVSITTYNGISREILVEVI